MGNPSQTILNEATRQWILESVAPGATLTGVRSLKGGVSSIITEITLIEGERIDLAILRQVDDKQWLQETPHLLLRERDALNHAGQIANVPVPRLLAVDPVGEQTGMPSLLMTRLAGEVVLEPVDLGRWSASMAKALTTVHAIDPQGCAWAYTPYEDASKLDTTAWSSCPELWGRAAGIVAGGVPSYEPRFIHRDYHPANVLWRRGEVSGIVDWLNACRGPAGVDVGHCRVNLALLHGVETADRFLQDYRSYAGHLFVYDPYWDLTTLIDFAYGEPEVYRGWTDLGITGLTVQLMCERLDRYLERLMVHYR